MTAVYASRLRPSTGVAAAPAPARASRRPKAVEPVHGTGAGHTFARVEAGDRQELEREADRLSLIVAAGAKRSPMAPLRARPGLVQKQERPETPPSITSLPGEVPADPEAEEEKKTAAMWEKLGTELAKEALKQFGKIPGVAEVYQAIEDLFDLPAVQIVGGIGYSASAATAIVVNAIDMQSRTEPGAVPPAETMFGVKGTWDFTSPPKDIKVMTPIGDLPPSFGEEKASSGGSTTLAGKPPSAVPEDPIGKNLREAQEEQFVLNWVLSRQDEILNPVKESRQKSAGRKKSKQKPKAPRKPAAASERRRRQDEWPSFKRRSESTGPAHDEPEVADAGRRTPGRPLDPEISDRMERSLGSGFGRVRIHTDAESAATAETLNARAYTVGEDVVFGAGEYRPATPEGLRLLAHELVHVVQQGGAPATRGVPESAGPRPVLAGSGPASCRAGGSTIAAGAGLPGSSFLPPAGGRIQRKCACGGGAGECEECRKQVRLQRKATGGGGPAPTGPALDGALDSPGQPIEPSTHEFLTSRFGHDFSRVRVLALPKKRKQISIAVGAPGDRYEQEADRVAEEVMRLPGPNVQAITAAGAPSGMQGIPRQATGCTERLQRETRDPFDPEEGLVEEEGTIQAKQAAGHAVEAPAGLHGELSLVRGGGQAMPESLRAKLEPRFGHDFSRVRIHTDAVAATFARSLNARAFTLGHDLVFGAGEYVPTTEAGQRLLAHELTHVIQQGEAPPIPPHPEPDNPGLDGGGREERVGTTPLATPSRDSGRNMLHEISAVSRESRTIRRVKWNPNTRTGRVSRPWGTGPSGDILEAATDAGTSIEIWRPHNGTTYWCHGYTFGGSSAKGGPYSMWGRTVPTVLNDDGWQQVYSCLAQAQDILVFFDGGGRAMHSGIVRSVSAPGSAIDEGASTLESKWGQQPLNTSSWRTNSRQYGGYRCYSKSGAQGPCKATGANELP